MTKQTLFSLIKTVLSAVGAFLIGKNFFGQEIDDNMLQGIVGAIMAVVSVVWSIVDKTAGIEQVQATLRQVVTLAGGFFIASGKLHAEQLEMWMGALLAIVSLIYSYLSKKKSTDIAEGQLPIANLKKSEPVQQVVRDIKPPADPIDPKMNQGK